MAGPRARASRGPPRPTGATIALPTEDRYLWLNAFEGVEDPGLGSEVSAVACRRGI